MITNHSCSRHKEFGAKDGGGPELSKDEKLGGMDQSQSQTLSYDRRVPLTNVDRKINGF